MSSNEEMKASPLYDNEEHSRTYIDRGYFNDDGSPQVMHHRLGFYELSQIKEESQEHFYSPDKSTARRPQGGSSASHFKDKLQFSVDHKKVSYAEEYQSSQ